MTTGPRHRAAVCVLRVEAHGARLMITLTACHDLDRRLYATRPGATLRTSDLDEALVVTDEFLREFAAGLLRPP
jgi:hypothetical protein